MRLRDLEPLALGKLLSQKRIETTMSYWVYLPPAPNRAEADRRAGELRSRGITEVPVDRQRAAALSRFRWARFIPRMPPRSGSADLVKLGVANARIGPRQQVITTTMLVIRDPQAQVVAKLRDLMTAYPATEAKVGGCDKA